MQRLDAEEIKARVNILDVIGRRVELKQRGRAWWGSCPFHQEKTPSFSVKPDEGFFKCFGCGKGGDVFAFIMESEGVDFPRALEILGGRRDMPPAPARTIPPAKAEGGRADDWRKHLDGLRPLYPMGVDGKILIDQPTPGAAYLEERGLTYWSTVFSDLKYHPRWYVRPAVVYALRDLDGRLVAAEGRCIDGKLPKVLTAGPKGGGVFFAFGALTRPDIVFVEGMANALTLTEVGFPAVATCGTDNLPDWLPELCADKRRVLIEFDNDNSGEAGTRRLCDLLAGADVPIYRLPILEPGMDWNDLLMKHGYRALREALQRELGEG